MFVKNPAAKWRWDGEKGDFIFIFAPLVRRYYLLNPTAAKVFSMCDGETDVDEIAKKIGGEEKITKVKEDVNKMIEHLQRVGIVFDADALHKVYFEKEAVLKILEKYCKSLSLLPDETIVYDDILRQLSQIFNFSATVHMTFNKSGPVTGEECERMKIEAGRKKNV